MYRFITQQCGKPQIYMQVIKERCHVVFVLRKETKKTQMKQLINCWHLILKPTQPSSSRQAKVGLAPFVRFLKKIECHPELTSRCATHTVSVLCFLILEFHANEIVRFLVGFTNKGSQDFNVQSLEASFRYPQDYQFYIQNVS